jgi:hypothetical protein
LPLLAAVAQRRNSPVVLDYLDGTQLAIGVDV